MCNMNGTAPDGDRPVSTWRDRPLLRRSPFFLAFAVALPVAAGAQAPATTPAPARPIVPAIAADACNACHGPDGKSTGAIPSLDQLDAATMSAKLKGFKSGEIESTVMNRLAKAFTDAELDALVRFIAAR
jgi:cytochrome c553